MLDHLSIASLAASPTTLAALGAVVLLLGEIAALLSLPNLAWTFAISTVAELGYVLIGLGVGGPAGDTGALMHLGYQAAMRGLVLAAGWHLVRRTGSANLNALAGSGPRMPVAATLFGFGVFSVMGLSPFKGSFSKFIVLYAAIEQGQWLVAFAGTLATIVAAVYYILVVQKICLEPAARSVELAPAPRAPLADRLAADGADHPHQPVAGAVPAFRRAPGRLRRRPKACRNSRRRGRRPSSSPIVGGFAVYLIGRASAQGRDVAAVLLAIATVAVVALDGGLDPASRLFALLFSGVCCLMIVYSIGYIGRAATANRYYFFAFLMAGSLIGVATAHEFGNFYVFWELMTWTSYFLVIHEQTPKALRAGLVYFLMCAAGAYLMNFGILLDARRRSARSSSPRSPTRPAVIPPLAGAAIVACLFVGFAVKMGLVPLQSWLPLAHPEAPSSISGPLSGMLTKAGLLGMVKVLYVAFGAGALARYAVNGVDANTVLMALGCLTLIYGEIRALFERELKRMLAFSTIAQIGEIAAILGIGTALATDAALLHVTNHAMMKTLLFYAAGAFILQDRRQAHRGSRRARPRDAVHRRRLRARQLRHHGPAAVLRLRLEVLHDLRGGDERPCRHRRADAARRHHRRRSTTRASSASCSIIPTRAKASAKRRSPMLVAMGVLAAAILVGGFAPGWQLNLIAQVGDLDRAARRARQRAVAGPRRRLAGRRDHRHRRRGRRAARRSDLGGLGGAARGRDAGRRARRRDRPGRALRPAVVRLRRADRRRRRAQHAALDRLSRRQPSRRGASSPPSR